MEAWNTTGFVSRKFFLRECPIILAKTLNTSRVRFALLQTNCYMDVQSRVLNWRHRATPWTKGAIIEVAGPSYASVDHCNHLIEEIVPFYATRLPCVKVIGSRPFQPRARRTVQSGMGLHRAVRFIPMSRNPGLHDDPDQNDRHKKEAISDDSFRGVTACGPLAKEPEEVRFIQRERVSPRMELRVPRSRTLLGRRQSSRCQNNSRAHLGKEKQLNNESAKTCLHAPSSPLDGVLPGQNDHNAIGVIEPVVHMNADQTPSRMAKRTMHNRITTFPRPKLFDFERPARLAVHSQKAAAVRASVQKMKDVKYKRFPGYVAHKHSTSNSQTMKSKLRNFRLSVTPAPKGLGDQSIREPIYNLATGLGDESPSLEVHGLHRALYRSIRGQDRYPPPPLPSRNQISGHTSSEIVANGGTTGVQQCLKTGLTSPKIQITRPAPTMEELTLGLDKTSNQTTDHRVEQDAMSGLVGTSDAPEFSYLPGSWTDQNASFQTDANMDTVTEETGNGRLVSHQPSISHSGAIKSPNFPNVRTATSSSSTHIPLSATPTLFSESDYPKPRNAPPGAFGKGQSQLPTEEGLNAATEMSKTITDATEYLTEGNSLPLKGDLSPDAILFSDLGKTEPPVGSFHVPTSTLILPRSIHEPGPLQNEATGITPTHLLSIVSPNLQCVQSCIVTQTKVQTNIVSFVKRNTYPQILSVKVFPAVRPRLFERIEFCTNETSELPDVIESTVYELPSDIDLGQVPRRSGLRTENGHTDNDDLLTGAQTTRQLFVPFPVTFSESKIQQYKLRKSCCENYTRDKTSDPLITVKMVNDSIQQNPTISTPKAKSSLSPRNDHRFNITDRRRNGWLSASRMSGVEYTKNRVPPISSRLSSRTEHLQKTDPVIARINPMKQTKSPRTGNEPSTSNLGRRLPARSILMSQLGQLAQQPTTKSLSDLRRLRPTLYIDPSEDIRKKSVQNMKFAPSDGRKRKPEEHIEQTGTETTASFDKMPESAEIGSSAQIPCYPPVPSPAASWVRKVPDNKTDLFAQAVDSQSIQLPDRAPDLTMFSSPSTVASQVTRSPGPCISLHGVPSTGSTELLVGIRSPIGSPDYKIPNPVLSDPVSGTKSRTNTTDETSDESSSTSESSESISETDSNDVTPYPSSGGKESTGQFTRNEKPKWVKECEHVRFLSKCVVRKPPYIHYESLSSQQIAKARTRKDVKTNSSVHTRTVHSRASKKRRRSLSVCRSLLYCISLAWCLKGD